MALHCLLQHLAMPLCFGSPLTPRIHTVLPQGKAKEREFPPIPSHVLYVLLEDRLPSGLMSFETNCL